MLELRVRHRVVLGLEPKETKQAIELDLEDEESLEEPVQALSARPRLLRRLLEGLVVDAEWNPLYRWRRYLMFSGKYRCRLYFFSRQMSRHDMTF